MDNIFYPLAVFPQYHVYIQIYFKFWKSENYES